ncbi:MAG: magnesium/cobalt transporter CorA [Saprospiraceae bacterium]|nr:magnesium/cobalt transporter CorA [Saprospiraceae bacterium]
MSKKKGQRSGMSPGSVIFTGDRKVEKINIHYLEFNADGFNNQMLDNISITNVVRPLTNLVQWYDVRGLHDTLLIQEIGHAFDLHPLMLEDIVNIHERPKLDEYDNGIFIQLKCITFDRTSHSIQTEHVSIFFGADFVLSFQEDDYDLFYKVRERITSPKSRLRKRKSDYLAYALVDVMILNLYEVLDQVEEVIQDLEKEVLQYARLEIKERIHHLKQQMLLLRKQLVPMREVCNRFYESDHELIEESTSFYIRDLNDHINQVIEGVETYRDMLYGLHELYLAVLSFQTNGVIQVLTIISTIFIPLTFLAGVYGMNFDNMPELHTKNGYFILLFAMLVLSLLMLYYFRRRKWL